MLYNNMTVGCKVFTNVQDWKIRVVFDEDGEPYFHGGDIAACLGYRFPTNAVAQSGIEVKTLPVPWETIRRRGCADSKCFTSSKMMMFIDRSGFRAPDGFRVWITEVVIPGARAEAEKRKRPAQEPIKEEPPAPVVAQDILRNVGGQPETAAKRIDEIILQLMLLKQTIA